MDECLVEKQKKNAATSTRQVAEPVAMADLVIQPETFMSTGISEMDRVLGQGLVQGAAYLLGGEPGIGKSTLALQIAQRVAGFGRKVLYVSGEESVQQLALRGKRVGDTPPSLMVLSQVNVVQIIDAIESYEPDFFILDSIQVVFHPDVPSVSGSVQQVRVCAMALIQMIKEKQIAGLFIGHITKDGSLAGPKALEHLVDVILYFEGESAQQYRLLRCVKNRYANTYELGVFLMNERGLSEVNQPSAFFIDRDTINRPGTAVSGVLEGQRVLLIEIQALVVDSGYGMAKRTFLGVDAHRANLMIAAIEKILRIKLSQKDIILNIIGGLRIKEPAVDLAIVAAILSSLYEKELPHQIGVFGEVGLTGEIRAVPHANKRLIEFEKMGFLQCVVPERNRVGQKIKTIKPLYVSTLKDALSVLF